ncbi:unnamed protein product [Blepharisma stoltei]|uniref:Calcium-dependent protein kinase n=1 Tax=Blepharisma stoltei TaxID=1481888 RepID=A0AAU9JQV7_9CILI|nr:unnamed protein product [Blepharisma stoltei]
MPLLSVYKFYNSIMGCCNSREEEKEPARKPKTPDQFLKRKKKLKRFNSNQAALNGNKTPESNNSQMTTKSLKPMDPDCDKSSSMESEKTSRTRRFSQSSLNLIQPIFSKSSNGNIKTLKVFAKSDFGSVKLISTYESDAKRVMKIIDLSKVRETEEDLVKLRKIKELDHPNIVKTYELIKTQNSIYLVRENLQGGSLLDRISKGNISEELACIYIHSILSALSYCHNKKIVHGNLKPNNILFASRLDHTSAKLISFGLSWNKIKMSSNLNALHFAAPEILEGKNENAKSDIWSLGVILHMMLIVRPPFHGETDHILIRSIEHGFTMDKNLFLYYSSEAQDLLEKMLVSNPNERISADEALDHPWFNRTIMKQKSFIRFLNFHTKNKIEKAILVSIINQQSLFEEKELKNIFDILDADHNQSINIKECYANHSLFGFTDHKEMKEIVEKSNIDDNYKFDFTVFVTAFTDWNAPDQIAKIKNALMPYDENNEGYLNVDKLKLSFHEYKNEEWQEFFVAADINNDKKTRIQKLVQFLSRGKSERLPNINIIMA